MKEVIEKQKKEIREAMISLNDYAGAFFALFWLFLVSCVTTQALFIGAEVPFWHYEFKPWMYVSNVIQGIVCYIGVLILWARDNRRLKEKEKK